MKLPARTIVPSLLLFACALLCHAQSAATTQPRQDAQPSPLTLGEWKEFAPAGGGFSILFPGAPQTTTETHSIGDVYSFELRAHTLKNPTLYCTVVYVDYPVPVSDPAGARGVLDGRVRGAPGSAKGELLSVSEITHEGHPGRMTRRRMPDGKILRVKNVLVGQRLYEIGFITPRPDGAPAEVVRHYEETAAKFIDSFKLVRATAAAGAAGPSGPLDPVGPPPDAPADAAGPGEVDQYLADLSRKVYRHEGEVLAYVGEGKIAKGTVVSKPQPPYPVIAKAARATGAVVVWVVVDEEGKVVAAQVQSGHPLLRASSVKAAREARFTPTLLDGKPVKVTGTITYNFSLH